MNAIINRSNEGHEIYSQSDYIIYKGFYGNFHLSIKCNQKASLSPQSHPSMPGKYSIPPGFLPHSWPSDSLPIFRSFEVYSLLSWLFCSILTTKMQFFLHPLCSFSTKIRTRMKGKYISGLRYKTMLTKFPLHFRKQFLNLTDLNKFSYVMTEIENPMIISQCLLKRQQYKYVLEKHGYKTEPLLCFSLKI